ncbi:hypothetical protein DL96DRAFT_1685636 [Flagelloscypha sp. PMI_526]|nr:hypothetical protein DL96DRAFT_1685636 [Flagelloscypha sp. PMI_526]
MKRHPDFFFDNLKVFLVEDTLFRVPIRKLVDESEYFKTMFDDGKPAMDSEKGEEGKTTDYPIQIRDESAENFALLMRWLYEQHTIKDFEAKEAGQLKKRFKTQSSIQWRKFSLCFDYGSGFRNGPKDAVSNICYGWNAFLLQPEADALPPTFRRECLKTRESIL